MIWTGLSSLKKRKNPGDLTSLYKYLMEGEVKQMEPVQVCLGCSQQEDKMHWVQTETQRFLPKHRKTPELWHRLHREGLEFLSILGGTQNWQTRTLRNPLQLEQRAALVAVSRGACDPQ